MVRLLKVNVPELVMPDPTALIVIIPELGVNVHVEPLIKVPATLKEVLAVTAVEEQAVVRLFKVKVPLFVIAPPPFTVIVPAFGVNVPVTLKVPPTVAVAVTPLTVPEIVKLLYVVLKIVGEETLE
jgi:hypothetical protein